MYKTRRLEAILDYITSLEGAHATVAQIEEYFEKEAAIYIGRTTIYRILDKLTKSGYLRRYVTDGTCGACYCYQYIDKTETENDQDKAYFHLKCENCGELLHLDGGTLSKINQHVFYNHAFEVNSKKTVLYGKCGNCLNIAK